MVTWGRINLQVKLGSLNAGKESRLGKCVSTAAGRRKRTGQTGYGILCWFIEESIYTWWDLVCKQCTFGR